MTLGEFLVAEGYEVVLAHDGDNALSHALAQSFDAAVLNIKMGSLESMDVVKKLREHQTTPILLLIASDDEQGMITGLEMGADGCLAKPLNPPLLLAHIRAMLRRGRVSPEQYIGQVLSVDDLVLQTGSRIVTCGGALVKLSGTELSLLEMLMRNAGCIVNRKRLLGHTWGLTHGESDRRLDTHISRVRKKLGPSPNGGIRIRSSRNAGYVLAI